MKNVDNVDHDQTAGSVQSDHDQHCPQKLLVSSSVRKKLTDSYTYNGCHS